MVKGRRLKAERTREEGEEGGVWGLGKGSVWGGEEGREGRQGEAGRSTQFLRIPPP